jgi:hypothetical protein
LYKAKGPANHNLRNLYSILFFTFSTLLLAVSCLSVVCQLIVSLVICFLINLPVTDSYKPTLLCRLLSYKIENLKSS